MTNIKYKLVIEQDGKDVHAEELGFHHVDGILAWFDTRSRYDESCPSEELIEFSSMHDSVEVRRRVAAWDGLNDDVLSRLAQDSDKELLCNLIRNDSFRSWVSTELLIKYIKTNVELACEIAENVADFQDPKALCDVLLSHKEPSVRRRLAGNSSAPKAAIRKLSKDIDLAVRTYALRMLKPN